MGERTTMQRASLADQVAEANTVGDKQQRRDSRITQYNSLRARIARLAALGDRGPMKGALPDLLPSHSPTQLSEVNEALARMEKQYFPQQGPPRPTAAQSATTAPAAQSVRDMQPASSPGTTKEQRLAYTAEISRRRKAGEAPLPGPKEALPQFAPARQPAALPTNNTDPMAAEFRKSRITSEGQRVRKTGAGYEAEVDTNFGRGKIFVGVQPTIGEVMGARTGGTFANMTPAQKQAEIRKLPPGARGDTVGAPEAVFVDNLGNTVKKGDMKPSTGRTYTEVGRGTFGPGGEAPYSYEGSNKVAGASVIPQNDFASMQVAPSAVRAMTIPEKYRAPGGPSVAYAGPDPDAARNAHLATITGQPPKPSQNPAPVQMPVAQPPAVPPVAAAVPPPAAPVAVPPSVAKSGVVGAGAGSIGSGSVGAGALPEKPLTGARGAGVATQDALVNSSRSVGRAIGSGVGGVVDFTAGLFGGNPGTNKTGAASSTGTANQIAINPRNSATQPGATALDGMLPPSAEMEEKKRKLQLETYAY